MPQTLQTVSDLEDLYELMRNDPAFEHLRRGQNPLVPGEGQNPCGVMVIGEAPGAHEVMQLRPFVGASGKVLRQLMSTAGLHSTYGAHQIGHPLAGNPNCWLTNTVKYRPPRNRTPTPSEVALSRPYLLQEWRLLGRPRLTVAVGAVALSAIYGRQVSIGKLAGHPQKLRKSIVWPMFHPAYGLRGSDKLRELIEQHWEELGSWIGSHSALMQ